MNFRTILGSVALISITATGAPAAAQPSAETPALRYEEVLLNATGREANLPLLVAFHYSGGTTREAIADYADLKGPVRIIAVRGTYPKRSGYSYFPVDYYALPADRQLAIARETVAGIAVLLDRLGQTYRARPVISGISQGGDIALLTAIYHPASIAAAFPFAAVIPEGIDQDVGASTPPVYIYQGDADPIVRVDVTRRRVAALNARTPIVLETFAGLGHDISPAMKASYTRRLDAVLSAQRRPEKPE